ncbi:MAG: threonine synthase [Lysobacteraceae bacterium]|nr:MAG: threonine synthase [Xanthomonadaceae bacterium]
MKQARSLPAHALPYVRCLTSLRNGIEYAADTLMNLSVDDHSPVQMTLDIDRVKKQHGATFGWDPRINSMWRFGALLPTPANHAILQNHIVSLGEGATPEVPLTGIRSIDAMGLCVSIKDEGGLDGNWTNPTGSFKDRGMAMVATMAKLFGLTRLAVPTQGNAGDSLARYGHHAGMTVAVAMPTDTPEPIKRSVAELVAKTNGAFELIEVEGTIREAGKALAGHFQSGWFNCATFQEPGWRIEGKKTLGLEMAEPKSRNGAWSLPDAIVYPTGGGTGLLGMWKAFDELQALGLIDQRRPKMIAVQSTQTQPLVQAIAKNLEDSPDIAPGETCAVGLNVPYGVGHFKVLDILRRSGGTAIAIEEQEIQNFTEMLSKQRIFPGPEGVATIAAIEPLFEMGALRSGDRVVVVNTGAPNKYL